MATVYEVSPGDLIPAAAKDLKENVKIKKPDWAEYVKTGAHVERIPENPDWWFHRAASVLRKVYINGPVGVQSLRVAYGSTENRGVKPSAFRKAGGKNVRVILQDFDKLGFTEKVVTKGQCGRRVTSKGQSYLDKIAGNILKK
ncbi:MAG: 30S ribosomal protein S19e [Candidatus Altiarchaeia archaeon]|jgi:small subunit ribosomal protein S19e